MTYIDESLCSETSLFNVVINSCYALLLRPFNKYNIEIDNFLQKFKYEDTQNDIEKGIKWGSDTYTQEDEENNNLNNLHATMTNTNYYNDIQEAKDTTNPPTNKRKLKDIKPDPVPASHKLQRSCTYSRLDNPSTIKSSPTPYPTERRRCASEPYSYADVKSYSNKLLPEIRCQYCEKVLRNDIVFVGADMTFCSAHCRRNTFLSFHI